MRMLLAEMQPRHMCEASQTVSTNRARAIAEHAVWLLLTCAEGPGIALGLRNDISCWFYHVRLVHLCEAVWNKCVRV